MTDFGWRSHEVKLLAEDAANTKTGQRLEDLRLGLVTGVDGACLPFWLLVKGLVSSPWSLSVGFLCVLRTWQVVFPSMSDPRERANHRAFMTRAQRSPFMSPATLCSSEVSHYVGSTFNRREISFTEGESVKEFVNIILKPSQFCLYLSKSGKYLQGRPASCLR